MNFSGFISDVFIDVGSRRVSLVCSFLQQSGLCGGIPIGFIYVEKGV